MKLMSRTCVSMVSQVLDALNQGEIPSAGSVVDSFNRGVMDRCLLIYETFMNKVKLPLPDVHLDDFHTGATDMALSAFEKDRFGRFHGDKAEVALKAELEKVRSGPLSFRILYECSAAIRNAKRAPTLTTVARAGRLMRPWF